MTEINDRNLFYHSFGGWKSWIKIRADSVSSEGSLSGLQVAAFTLCPYMASSLCACREKDLWSLLLFLLEHSIGLGPHFYDLILLYLIS